MKSTQGVYIGNLDHLRGLAALLVFVWHYLPEPFKSPYVPRIWTLSIFVEGHTGVALFMVLSGYLFAFLTNEKVLLKKQFYFNRFIRLFPLLFVWTIFNLNTQSRDIAKVATSLFSLINFTELGGGAWTIAVEAQYYLILPVLLLAREKYGIRYLAGFLAFSIFTKAAVWWSTGSVHDLAYWTIFGRIDQFLLGMVGFYTWRKIGLDRKPAIAVLLASLIALSYVYHTFNQAGGFYKMSHMPSRSALWIFLPAIEGLLYTGIILGYQQVRLPLILDKVLSKVGECSYSIYLSHYFLLAFVAKLCGRIGMYDLTSFRTTFLGCVLIAFPLVVLFSRASYVLLERPFLDMRREYLLKKPSGQSASVRALAA
ncbi:MAG: acyltransferase [Burkholderiaceae bacterium]|jgi:peptidoglycan/LPS O-acetylase OafA/YrhL|nr:acyltransferase [Burkholderiaceae bacterium]